MSTEGLPRRELVGEDTPVRLPCERESSSVSTSEFKNISPQRTNRGSSRGAALSSVRSDILIVVSPAESGNKRSKRGRPRYVCSTSNTSGEYRECMLVSGSGASAGSDGGISESSPKGETAAGRGGGDGESASSNSGVKSASRGETHRIMSSARAVRPDSKDCISRRARGRGRNIESSRGVGESKVTPGPNGYGI